MPEHFDIDDWVTWRTLGDLPELWDSWEYEIPELIKQYGRGPFIVKNYERARVIAHIVPPHPQLLLIALNGELVPRKFSGIMLRKLS